MPIHWDCATTRNLIQSKAACSIIANVRVVVTGGAGFIGSHLVRSLLRTRTYQVLIIDNLHRPCTTDPTFGNEAEFSLIDIRDRAALGTAVRGAEVIFHLAAQSNVMGSVADAEYTFQTNVAGSVHVLEAARLAGSKRVVFTSSREVYGEPAQLPVRESEPLRPKNAYGVSKAAAELYCGLAAAQGLEAVILRLANVYGWGDRDRVIPLFVDAARAGDPLTVYGGKQILDFVWIDTVVNALMQAAFGPWLPEPINIGSGFGVTVIDLAQRIVQLTSSNSVIEAVPSRTVEVTRFVADVDRARRLLAISSPSGPLEQLPVLTRPPHYAVATQF